MSNMWSGSHFVPNNHAINVLQSHLDPENFMLTKVVNRTECADVREIFQLVPRVDARAAPRNLSYLSLSLHRWQSRRSFGLGAWLGSRWIRNALHTSHLVSFPRRPSTLSFEDYLLDPVRRTHWTGIVTLPGVTLFHE
ncbi:hypothetical protein J6590_076488 [Homalodisca vitripennis]|nr:hypothetical protein J6590_076488 [Homalodisca vitripennis]